MTPLVLIPGLAATSRFFTAAARDLAVGHEVVTVELPMDRPATVREAAEELALTLARLDLRDATLVGWSLGASVAYEYLDRFGQGRVAALVSVEQTPRLTLAEDWPHAAFGGLDAAGVERLKATIATDPAAFADSLVRGSFAAGGEPEESLVDELVGEALRWTPEACAALLTSVSTSDYRDVVARITVPTLLIHGARSQVYPTGVGDWLAATIPAAELRVFPDSGHLPFIEERERFVAAVTDMSHRGAPRSTAHV